MGFPGSYVLQEVALGSSEPYFLQEVAMGCMERSVPKEVATDSPNPSRKRSLYIYIYGFTETLCPVRARYGFPVVPQVQSSDSSCIFEHFFLCFFKIPVHTVQLHYFL